jgi:hypothetical protein
MRNVNNMAAMGRGGDTMMAHVTPGEIMVPPQVQTPELVAAITRAIQQAGGNPQEYIAGQGSINPYTGQEEFFFKKIFKAIGKFLPALSSLIPGVGPIVSPILGALFNKQKEPKIQQQPEVKPAQATPFTPERPEAISAPSGLNELAGYAPEQQRSSLATTGLNQGLGSEEDKYYRNLLQRSLIGEGNQVQQQDNFLLPVESQYFSKKGYDTSNIMNFLQAIRG